VTNTASVIDVETPPVITLDAGLPGFPDAHHFILVKWGGDASPFSLLRCLDREGLEFVVVPPELFFSDYRPAIDDAGAQRLELRGADDALLVVIITLGDRPQEATANLLGPIVINRHTLHGAQLVLPNAELDVRTPLSSR